MHSSIGEEDRYCLTELEDSYYQFHSESGNLYDLYFKLSYQNDVARLYSGNPNIEVYEIFFEIVHTKKTQVNDVKIVNTLLFAVEEFLHTTPERIVFYITSRDDERNKALFKFYEIWFRKYLRNSNTLMRKLNRVILFNDSVVDYISFFYLDCDFDLNYIDNCLDTVLTEIYPNYRILDMRV